MTIVGEALVVVRPETAGFTSALLKDVEKASAEAGKAGSRSFSMGWVAAGAIVVGALTEATISAAKYQKTITLLQTQAGASRQEVARMGTALLALAPQVGQGPDKLAEAMYHIESVGYRGAQALDVLKISAEGAKISGANLDDTTYALTSTLQTGIGGIHNATDAMAALNAIVGTGDMRMQDLNGAISTGFLATAETFGVDIRSIGAALAYMTDRGSGAQESATRLRMSLALMAAPSNKAATMLTAIGLGGAEVSARTGAMTEALQKAGLTTTRLSDDLRKPDGIQVALTDLVTHLKDSGLSADAASALISRAFGGGRSGAAIMSLVQHLDILKKKFDDQGRLAGQFGAAWTATTETTSFKFSQLTALIEADGIRLGNALMPAVTSVGTGLFQFLSDAPHLFAPVGSGLADVGHSLMDVQHSLEPIESLIAKAFGGVVLLSIHGIGAGLHLIAGALQVVADLANFFDHNAAAAGALAAVLAVALLPRLLVLAQTLTTMALDKLALGLFNAAGAAGALGSKLAGLNPWVVATAVAIGAGVAVYEHYTHAKQAATVATNDLVTALQKESQGQNGALISSVVEELNKAGVGDNISRLGLNIRDVAQAIVTGGDSMTSYQTALKAVIENSKTEGHGAFTQTAQDAYALQKAVGGLSGELDSADGKYANMTRNQKIASDAMAAARKPVNDLAQAQKDLATANTDFDKAQAAVLQSAQTYSTELQKQFPIFDAYVAKVQLNGQALLKNIEGTTKAILGEQGNVNTLLQRGLDPAVIKSLADKGPEYIAAAAQLSVQQLQQLQTDTGNYMDAIGNLGVTLAKNDGTKTGQAYAAALAHQQGAAKNAALLTFYTSVQDAVHSAGVIAGNGGTATGDQFSDRVLAKKNTVLTAMLNALPAPVRTATLQALGIATDAGGRLPANLAQAIAASTPLAAQAAQNLKDAVQSKIDALHGKTVSVEAENKATVALEQINGDIVQLEGLNNTLKAMRFARGGIVPGNDGATADNHLILASSGEAIVPTHVVPHVAPILARHGVPGFAKGGIVDGGIDGLQHWPVLLGGYAQSMADKLSSNAFIAGLASGGGASGSVASWAPTILAALGIAGAPAAWLPLEERLMSLESGGSATITNPISVLGQHATGLMQMLPSTFAAHALPGLGGITNGLANLVSSIRYQEAVYGSPANIPGLFSGHYGGYDNGGPLMPGWNLAYNGTKKPENVRTHQADDQMLDALKAIEARIGNARPVTQEVHYNGVDPALAQRDANRELAHALRGL